MLEANDDEKRWRNEALKKKKRAVLEGALRACGAMFMLGGVAAGFDLGGIATAAGLGGMTGKIFGAVVFAAGVLDYIVLPAMLEKWNP